MENANKFKVVRDITVLDCSTPYMFEQTKKHIADKYKGLGIADDAMLAKLWENVEVDFAQNIYPTVVDFELTKYDSETVKAAFREIGDVRGRTTDNRGNDVGFFDLNKKAYQLPFLLAIEITMRAITPWKFLQITTKVPTRVRHCTPQLVGVIPVKTRKLPWRHYKRANRSFGRSSIG